MIQFQIQTFGCLQRAVGVYTLTLNRDPGLNLSTRKHLMLREMSLDIGSISVGLADTSVSEQNRFIHSLGCAGFLHIASRQTPPQ